MCRSVQGLAITHVDNVHLMLTGERLQQTLQTIRASR
jgi:hypothetical protein